MALTKVSGHVVDQPFELANINATGIGTFANLRVTGDLQVDGTTTTLDTVVTSVDRLEVGANNNTVGVAITQSGTGDIFNLYDGSSEVFSVADGGTVTVTGNIVGVTSAYATKFYGDGSNLTNLAVDATKIETGNTKVETIDTGSDGHIKVTTEGTERLRVQKGGNVTIGTTVEDTGAFRTFHIHGDYTRIKLTDQFSGTGNTDGLDIQCTGGSAYYKFYENGHVYFSSNNTNRLQITNTGDIKVLTAGAMLDGNTNLLLSVSGTERVRIGSSGEIGIGGTNYGASGQVLTSGGTGSAPSWTTLSVDATKIETGNNKVETIGIGTGGEVKVTTGGTERVIINGDGSNSVKVGTAATFTGAFTNLQLHNAGGSSRIVLTDQFTGSTQDDGFHIQCSGGGATLNLKENSHLYFRTNALLRASVKNSGEFKMHGSNAAVFGDNEYFKIYYDGSCNIENTHNASNFFIASALGMQLRVNTSEPAVSAIANGKVQLFYDGSEKFETSSSGVKALGTLNLGSYQNSGLTYSPIYNNAVDVFVYDTRKDSDGGAWRKKTQETSWYNETLGNAVRGSRKDFPAVAVLVLEDGKLTIYDGDDPTMPMWMTFNTQAESYYLVAGYNDHDLRCVTALNGIIAVGNAAGYNHGGLIEINFIRDDAFAVTNSNNKIWTGGIVNRNSNAYWQQIADGNYLVSNNVRDVAMTVLPHAKTDVTTGLPIPTIAVATAAGVSIVRDDQGDSSGPEITNRSIINLIETSGPDSVWRVKFRRDGKLGFFTSGTAGQSDFPQAYYMRVPGYNPSFGYYYQYTSHGIEMYGYGGEAMGATRLVMQGDLSSDLSDLTDGNGMVYASTNTALNIISPPDKTLGGAADMTTGMIAYVGSDYNTGYMPGVIKGAFLSDTSTSASAELVTNGYFNSDVSGWTVGAGTATLNSNRLLLTSPDGGATWGYVYQALTTVVGQKYALSFHYDRGTVDGRVNLRNDTTNTVTGSVYYSDLTSTHDGKTFYKEFTATGTTTYIFFYSKNTTAGTNAYDQISVSTELDRTAHRKGLQVHGTVNKSVVATNAELVGYSNFSASNHLRQPPNPDMNIGTGNAMSMIWYYTTNSSATMMLMSYEGGANGTTNYGAPFNIRMEAGKIRGWASYNNFTNYDSALHAQNTADGKWHCAAWVKRGQGFELYVDGEFVGYTGGQVLSNALSDGNSELVIGGRKRGNHPGTCEEPFIGSLALARFGHTAPTADQIRKMYVEERQLFLPNAKATLYGSSDAVVAMGFDDGTNTLHVGTSAGRSEFNGLRRINNTTTAVTTAISASNELVAEQ